MKINENMVKAIMATTPHNMRGSCISARAIKQGNYKAFDIYLEQVPTIQGFASQLVITCNNRIL